MIGQILEYAAYLWNMTYEDLDSRIREKIGRGRADAMAEKTGESQWDEKAFHEGVIETLKGGTFNLIIIAVDSINEELRRIINYLNECGNASFTFHALDRVLFRILSDTRIHLGPVVEH
ncbi:MAG: hypothetical protein ABSB63_20745 [Spirochaetia bacterium]